MMREIFKFRLWLGSWIAAWIEIFYGIFKVITFCSYFPAWDFKFFAWLNKRESLKKGF